MAARACFTFISMSWAGAISPGLPAEYDVEKATDFTRPAPARQDALCLRPRSQSFEPLNVPCPRTPSGSALIAALLDGLFEHRIGIGLGGDIAATLTDFFPVCYPHRSILRQFTFSFFS